jgi:biopolymer transport protein ExbD
MPIQYGCEGCGLWLSISHKKIGVAVPCPQCGALKVVPATDEVPVADAGISEPDARQPVPPADDDDDIVFAEYQAEAEVAPEPAVQELVPPGRVEPARVEPEPVAQPEPAFVAEEPVPAGHSAGVSSSAPAEANEAGPPFKLRRRPPDTEEMDLTPMVDMTFLLLIFFMITASLQLQKALEMPAPNPDQSGAQQSLFTPEQLEQTCIRVSIDDNNHVLIEDEPAQTPEQILERLKLQMRTTQRYELVVAASPSAFHETVVTVIDAAQAAGMEKIRMIGHTGEF